MRVPPDRHVCRVARRGRLGRATSRLVHTHHGHHLDFDISTTSTLHTAHKHQCPPCTVYGTWPSSPSSSPSPYVASLCARRMLTHPFASVGSPDTRQSASPYVLLLVAMVAYMAVRPCGYCLATVSARTRAHAQRVTCHARTLLQARLGLCSTLSRLMRAEPSSTAPQPHVAPRRPTSPH